MTELEGAIEESEDAHKSEIEDLEQRLEDLKKKEADQRGDISDKAADRQSDMAKIKDGAGQDFEEIKTINDELSTLRDRAKQVREDLTMRLMDMTMCGCKPSADLLQQSTVLRHLEMEMPEGYECCWASRSSHLRLWALSTGGTRALSTLGGTRQPPPAPPSFTTTGAQAKHSNTVTRQGGTHNIIQSRRHAQHDPFIEVLVSL